MNGREIIKEVMQIKNQTNADLAKKLGITQAALWDRIDTVPRKGKARKDMPASSLAEMLDLLGYKLIAVPSDTPIPDGGYDVDKPDRSDTENTAPAEKSVSKSDLDALLAIDDDAPVVTESAAGRAKIKLT